MSFNLCLTAVSQVILDRVPKPKGGYSLAMDRTNWKFGRRHLNFLVIAIIVGKVSIPIAWSVLPQATKRGNSNTAQRKKLTQTLLEILPAKDIKVLTMDREFVGKSWLGWLGKKKIGYIVRLKKNAWVGSRTAGERASSPGRRIKQRQEVFGLALFFACKKIKEGGRASHLMIVSNRFEGSEALKLYRQRWGIERLFGHLKKNGFDLEATHMTDGRKLEKLFALVVLAYLYSFAWGCHLRANGRKKSAAANRKSHFRLGLENILTMLESVNTGASSRRKANEFFHWLKADTGTSISLV